MEYFEDYETLRRKVKFYRLRNEYATYLLEICDIVLEICDIGLEIFHLKRCLTPKNFNA